MERINGTHDRTNQWMNEQPKINHERRPKISYDLPTSERFSFFLLFFFLLRFSTRCIAMDLDIAWWVHETHGMWLQAGGWYLSDIRFFPTSFFLISICCRHRTLCVGRLVWLYDDYESHIWMGVLWLFFERWFWNGVKGDGCGLGRKGMVVGGGGWGRGRNSLFILILNW